MNRRSWVLPVIVVSQFFCTSLWFAGNGVMTDLVSEFSLQAAALGHLTSAVQLGFISGTLLFALLMIADRYSPSRVFLFSALAGSLFNLGIVLEGNDLISLIILRFLTGFSLAGIYPVGMKIAADYFSKGLGKSLGYLVGALVVGTALPHLLKDFTGGFPWYLVVYITSGLAITGGLLMVSLVPDGPYRKHGLKLDPAMIVKVFKKRDFRSVAFGYFGHMWELYAFWAFTPVMLAYFLKTNSNLIPLLSFLVIGLGGLSCVAGGYLSRSLGTRKVAFAALFLSCSCCFISPLVFQIQSDAILIAFFIFWGLVVIADSPLFSTMVAQNSAPETRGTALTIVNSIGFFITIISIQLLNYISTAIRPQFLFLMLTIGPFFGLLAMVSHKTVKINRMQKEPALSNEFRKRTDDLPG